MTNIEMYLIKSPEGHLFHNTIAQIELEAWQRYFGVYNDFEILEVLIQRQKELDFECVDVKVEIDEC